MLHHGMLQSQPVQLIGQSMQRREVLFNPWQSRACMTPGGMKFAWSLLAMMAISLLRWPDTGFLGQINVFSFGGLSIFGAVNGHVHFCTSIARLA